MYSEQWTKSPRTPEAQFGEGDFLRAGEGGRCNPQMAHHQRPRLSIPPPLPETGLFAQIFDVEFIHRGLRERSGTFRKHVPDLASQRGVVLVDSLE